MPQLAAIHTSSIKRRLECQGLLLAMDPARRRSGTRCRTAEETWPRFCSKPRVGQYFVYQVVQFPENVSSSLPATASSLRCELLAVGQTSARQNELRATGVRSRGQPHGCLFVLTCTKAG